MAEDIPPLHLCGQREERTRARRADAATALQLGGNENRPRILRNSVHVVFSQRQRHAHRAPPPPRGPGPGLGSFGRDRSPHPRRSQAGTWPPVQLGRRGSFDKMSQLSFASSLLWHFPPLLFVISQVSRGIGQASAAPPVSKRSRPIPGERRRRLYIGTGGWVEKADDDAAARRGGRASFFSCQVYGLRRLTD